MPKSSLIYVRKNKKMIYIDFHKRFDPSHLHLKNDIKNNKFGKLQYGYAYMEDKISVPSQWLKKWAKDSSPSWFLGTHFYDLVYWLTNSLPEKIYATGNKGKLNALGINTYDSIQVNITYENGMNFTFHTSWILPNSFTSIVNQSIRIIGEEGICEVDTTNRGLSASYSDAVRKEEINPHGKQEVEDYLLGTKSSGYIYESMIYFIDLIFSIKNEKIALLSLKGKYPSGEEALVSTRIGELIEESLRTSTIVKYKGNK